MTDLWKPLRGNPRYSVHPDGFIRDNSRSHHKSGGILRPTSSGSYPRVTLVAPDSPPYKVKLAYVIASYFVPRPPDCKFVNYIDGNLSNNAASNLQWVTRENADEFRHLPSLKHYLYSYAG